MASRLGAIQALIAKGHIRPYLKKSDAYRLYGRTNVDKWLKAGLLTPRKDGSHSAAWRIERMEIELLYLTMQFPSHLS